MAKYISTEPLPVGVSEAEFQCERDGLTIRGTEYRRAGERLPIAVVSHGIRPGRPPSGTTPWPWRSWGT